MSRTPIITNRENLTKIIVDLEAAQTFPNQNSLFKKVAAEYYEKYAVRLSPALVYLRVREFGLTLKTPKGKKGRQKGAIIVRKAKESGHKSLVELRSVVPERFHPIIERAENGSKTARIKLKCLDCCNYQTSEIRNCGVKECSLYDIRPYRNG